MFDVTELYSSWTEDPESFWQPVDATPQSLQELLTVSPESLLDDDVWGQVLVSACPPADEDDEFDMLANEWLGTLINSLREWSQLASKPGAAQDQCQEALEKLIFLVRLHLARLDTLFNRLNSRMSNSRRTSTGKPGDQLVGLLGAVSRTIQGGISAMFPATAASRRSALAMLYLEPSLKLLQYDVVLKDSRLVLEITRVVCLSVKLQHQDAMARSQILQLLLFYQNSVGAVVVILETLQVQFDHASLAEGILKDIAVEAAGWTDSQSSAMTSRAKAVNAFLTGMGDVAPNLVVANLSSIAILIGSPVAQLRQAILDLAVPVVKSILAENSERTVDQAAEGLEGLSLTAENAESGGPADSDAGPHRLKAAFDLIKLVELRVNDVSHFCRLRAVQALASVAPERAFISRRNIFAQIAVTKMKDRTQLVRRQAMRLMKELIDTYPPFMHDNLSHRLWESSLVQINEQLEDTEPSDIRNQLVAAKAFVNFTLEFLSHVDEALQVAQTLLLSKSKSDILDAIDLLDYADSYSIETSKPGIRQILHLVWAKADNDEENAVLNAALKTYRELFMTAPAHLDARQGAKFIADNLINLTTNATEGELTSLERLLSLCAQENFIDVPVISRLWGIYQTQSDVGELQRRGAAIVLSMLSSADSSIARSGLSSVVKIGLADHGHSDLILAEYSCSILRRFIDKETDQRLPVKYELFDKMIDFLLVPAEPKQSMQWINMAKESLAAMNSLCDCAPELYTRILREYIERVFKDKAAEYTEPQRQQLFGQMLFLSGEIALNLLVYLEWCDATYKKRSQEELQKGAAQRTTAEEEEQMAAGGTREDDFEDALRDIKEDVILFSDGAILKTFGEVVVNICQQQLEEDQRSQRTSLPSDTSAYLQMIGATQSLAKFMCVSSKFCEKNLSLLMDLLAQHPNSVVRSNLVVALSDIAVSFNRLIDQHTEYLYDRLQDPDPEVQRTCIVALTFLILAGQIKVKGKLGEMAKAIAHPNRDIAKLTTMFFRELATKENAIYNSFLDMLSTLIADDGLSETDMLSIVKFLSKFVERERHIKQINDKLLFRLPRCSSQRQWNAYVQVLRNMPHKLDDQTKEIIALGYRRNPGENLDDDDMLDDLQDPLDPQDVQDPPEPQGPQEPQDPQNPQDPPALTDQFDTLRGNARPEDLGANVDDDNSHSSIVVVNRDISSSGSLIDIPNN